MTRETRRGARSFNLTPKEFDLLTYLMRHPRQVMPRDRILQDVWGYDFDGNGNVLEVYVGYLRNKTEANGEAAFDSHRARRGLCAARGNVDVHVIRLRLTCSTVASSTLTLIVLGVVLVVTISQVTLSTIESTLAEEARSVCLFTPVPVSIQSRRLRSTARCGAGRLTFRARGPDGTILSRTHQSG